MQSDFRHQVSLLVQPMLQVSISLSYSIKHGFFFLHYLCVFKYELQEEIRIILESTTGLFPRWYLVTSHLVVSGWDIGIMEWVQPPGSFTAFDTVLLVNHNLPCPVLSHGCYYSCMLFEIAPPLKQ